MRKLTRLLLVLFILTLIFYWGWSSSKKPAQLAEKNFDQNSFFSEFGKRFFHQANRLTDPSKSTIRINGMAMSLTSLTSEKSVAQLISEYSRQWQTAGEKVVQQNFGKIQSVMSYDPHARIVRTMMAFRDESRHQTYLFPAHLKMNQPVLERKVKLLPEMSQSRKLFHLESDEGGFNGDTFVYLSSWPPGQIERFFHTKMHDLGWKPSQGSVSSIGNPGGNELLFFENQDQECLVVIVPSQGQTLNGSLIYLILANRRK